MPRHEAICAFKFKFWQKTNNEWSNRKNFRCHSKKYTWLEIDYGRGDKETKKEFVANQETKLETQTAHSISVIRDINMLKQQMVETGYDADKLPLGKISKSTILKFHRAMTF
ncbi:poly [ADP-ribose] polymerase 2-like [Triticum aestivum]|uniref:poly [ADP-ribose] polymerase 2-like n=1 Tax=Triticum aestivum TaxID=4565 RepID=UPI001D030E28|nr:poly [ADP-ribose] polymerase 2-like [Triticum aestivum]